MCSVRAVYFVCIFRVEYLQIGQLDLIQKFNELSNCQRRLDERLENIQYMLERAVDNNTANAQVCNQSNTDKKGKNTEYLAT